MWRSNHQRCKILLLSRTAEATYYLESLEGRDVLCPNQLLEQIVTTREATKYRFKDSTASIEQGKDFIRGRERAKHIICDEDD